MCSDIAKETKTKVIAILKPEMPLSDTFRKFFHGDIYRDPKMTILTQITQGNTPSTIGLITMWSSWHYLFKSMYVHPDNNGIAPGISTSLNAEGLPIYIEAPTTTVVGMATEGYLTGGMMILDHEGNTMWSHNKFSFGDFASYITVRDKVNELKTLLGY